MRDKEKSREQLIEELEGMRRRNVQLEERIGNLEEESRRDEADRVSRERMELVLRATNDGIWDWDTITGESYFSPRYYTMLGYEPAEFPPCYESWRNLIHPDDLKGAEEIVQNGVNNNRSYAVEFRMKARDGSWRWILSRGMGVERDGNNRSTRMVGSHTDITGRKEAESYLEIARTIIDRANSGITLLDRAGRILDVNRKAAEILGYSVSELELLSIIDIDPHATSETWPVLWDNLRRVGSERVVSENRRKDGSLIPVEIYGFYLEFGGEEYMVAFTQDISDRIRSEEALREKDVLLRDVGQQAKIGAWKVDLETGRVTNTNEIARIYDLDDREDVNINLGISLYTDESRATIEKAYADLCSKGIPYDLELEIISARGKHKWIRTQGYPIRKEGRIVQVQGSFQDISASKESEILYRKSEKIYYDLVELSPLGIGVLDSRGRLVNINPALSTMLGYDPEEMLKLSLQDICHPGDYPPIKSELDSLAGEEKRSFSREVHFRKGGGEYFWVNITVAKTENLCGPGVYFSSFCEDISSRKNMEEQLGHSRKMEAIGQLAGGIAHDFNNMLAGIMAAAELLQNTLGSRESSSREYLDMIVESSERASLLIAKLLAFSRKDVIVRENIDSHKVIKEALAILTRTINRKIAIHTSLNARSSLIKGDASSLLNAVLNLSINASQAMKEGGTSQSKRATGSWIPASARKASCPSYRGTTWK